MQRGARLLRLLFTVAGVISSVLAAGTAAVWVRSHWVGDAIEFCTSATKEGVHVVEGHTLRIGGGLVRLDTDYNRFTPGAPDRPWSYRRELPDRATWGRSGTNLPWPQRLGFLHLYRFDANVNWYEWNFGQRIMRMPLWVPLFVFSIAPGYWLVRQAAAFRRRGRRVAGICPTCGYDLRATPGRCPECGSAIPSSSPAVA
jgi:hypothetical protein